jgi:antitoxin (DNA-binding transcriptional repressor) of toxin-antitoxin stability system
MAKEVIHISEAASNFADVLSRVRAGAEIVIDGHNPSW